MSISRSTISLGYRTAFDADTALSDVNWIALDVETTGLSPGRGHNIREVAIFDDFGGQLITKIRTDTPRERCRAGPPDPSENWPEFADLAGEISGFLQRGVMVGHNAAFDLSFLQAEFASAAFPYLRVAYVDTLAIARKMSLPGRLNLLAAAFEIPVARDGLHTAGYDAALTRQVLNHLIARTGAVSLGQLGMKRMEWWP